ncbi:MAG: hypothetical protein HWN65_01080 [Candidatus Helarchaeota archaeon]|nr:hypothetical protein [Candidatus Helarchaeota archaeon]
MVEALSLAPEDIPNEDQLYYRYHKQYYKKRGEIRASCFRIINNVISTNWSRYSTPEICQEQAKVPSDNGIIKINVGEVRNIDLLDVQHNPREDNRAHTHIIGFEICETQADKNEIRVKLSNISSWVIELNFNF